ncbi:MAG: methyltransferase domain-containing protein [Deltaproteobacteria bacterium]|nr:methyltransferase domain-containing protein [Deltaproteobacteria bacterium]
MQDKVKWNKKYRQKKYSTTPSQIVRNYFELAPGKNALDIGAGNGRNSLFLARQGFSVDAVDISDEGLKQFAGRHSDIHPICEDLDTFDIPGNRYDLIINVKYLNRRIFPYIKEGLRPGGLLIFETFLETGYSDSENKIQRDYLLRENELLHAFLSLHILYYSERPGKDNDGQFLASLVAVKKSGQ